MIKNKHKVLLIVGVLGVLVVGISSVHAIRLLTKAEEVQLKQDMKPQNAERSVDLIGIFAPGFEQETASAKADYVKEYGEGNFHVLKYNGYTLIVPPIKAGEIDDAKAKINAILVGQEKLIPSADVKTSQVAKICEVFDIEDKIDFNATIGAYTDESGFQYNFVDGELVSKQVGINSSLHAKFEQAYPHLKRGGIVHTATITNEQAKEAANQVIEKIFVGDRADTLKANAQIVKLGEARIGIVYGDNEVQVLVDNVTGDIIHFSKNK